jgi:hypothetical protein
MCIALRFESVGKAGGKSLDHWVYFVIKNENTIGKFMKSRE